MGKYYDNYCRFISTRRRTKKAYEIATNMIKQHMDKNVISKITGLSTSDLSKLHHSIK